ncbi:hypothetical protein RND71_034191 [Anisodus tanguticus]|uniref:Uncharacterized protein n=1 Tax=Anisodus tanguticus TaxID=243964 RepID=A0AAE1RC71_9SOLA|nr:hypothetical protein RND71_034191 [Anisodus tanguticus]
MNSRDGKHVDILSELAEKYKHNKLVDDSLERCITQSSTIEDEDPKIKKETEALESDIQDENGEELPKKESKPNSLSQLTHKYIHRQRIASGLRELGWMFQVCNEFERLPVQCTYDFVPSYEVFEEVERGSQERHHMKVHERIVILYLKLSWEEQHLYEFIKDLLELLITLKDTLDELEKVV